MQRNTLQRQFILEILTNSRTHPSIEEIYIEIQKKYPSISKTTIYRNLRQLTKDGVIGKVLLQDGLERYDTRTEQHYHYKCENCDRIYDIDIPYLKNIDKEVQKKYGLNVDKHDIIFIGLCSKCKNAQKESLDLRNIKL